MGRRRSVLPVLHSRGRSKTRPDFLDLLRREALRMTEAGGPFTQKETIDKPGIIGARWWQESIATEVPRRKAITAFIALGGALAGVAAIGLLVAKGRSSSSGGGLFSSQPEVEFQPRTSLDMQSTAGTSARPAEQLVFDGLSHQPFDRTSLDTLATDLAPASPVYTLTGS